MPATFGTAKISFIASTFTFEEFSVAYELYLLNGKASKYKKDEIFNDYFKDKTKKKKAIDLIMKVKSQKIKQRVVIPMDAKISLSDIDMVIQEVLFKPQVKIYVD